MKKTLIAIALLTLTLSGCTKIQRNRVESTGNSAGSGAATGNGTTGVSPGVLNGAVTSGLSSVTCAVTTALPSYWRNSASESLAFSCDGSAGKPIASTDCQFDEGAWGSCSPSGKLLSPLVEGAHKFRVRGIASDGAIGISPYALWSTDLTPPTISNASVFAMAKNSPTLQFSGTDNFGGSGFAGYQCRVLPDLATWETCTSPRTYPSLAANKSYDFQVRAQDVAGNWSQPTVVAFMTTAFVAPGMCSVTSNVPASTPLKTLALTFACATSDDPIASVECRLDQSAWAPCQSPTSQTLTNLTEGPHEEQIRFVTTLGNASVPQTVSWTVDTTPPNISIGTAVTSNLTPSFAFSANDPGNAMLPSTQCRLEKQSEPANVVLADWAPCTSPHTYSSGIVPSQGYFFKTKAVDAAGNASAPVESFFIGNPGVGPACVVPPVFSNGYSNVTSPAIGFGCSSPVSYTVECNVDNSGWMPCTNGMQHDLHNLAPGQHSFAVRGKDDLGNQGAASAPLTWSVDTVAPSVVINSTENDHPTVRLTVSASDAGSPISKIECQLVSPAPLFTGAWEPCSSGEYVKGGLTLGATYSANVRSVDLAGNTSPVVSTAWGSQPAEPAPVCVSTAAALTTGGYTKDAQRSFGVQCTDTTNGVTKQCSPNGTAWATCTDPYIIGTPTTGQYCVHVRGKDTYNRVGPVDMSCWKVDHDNPTVSIGTPTIQDTNSSNDTLTIHFYAGDLPSSPAGAASGVAGTQCKFRQLKPTPAPTSSWVTCTSPFVKKELDAGNKPNGEYDFQVRATDNAGNVGSIAVKAWKTGELSSGTPSYPIPQYTAGPVKVIGN